MPEPQQEPKPEYVLVNDVTGPPVPRGPQILEIYGQKVRVPHPPKENCKKCYGRGYIGRDAATGMIIFCHKCYA